MRRAKTLLGVLHLTAALVFAILVLPGAALAQEVDVAPQSSESASERSNIVWPVYVFDRDRVLSESDAAKSLLAEIEASRAALLEENARIYAELEAEEREISLLRESLSDEAFRARATSFDTKVTEVRAEQDRKAQDIQTQYEDGIQDIEVTMNSVLTEIARERGAAMIFERQQVYLASSAVDITMPVINALNERGERAGTSP
ncbi:OmpH family outer membrane protein [Celeribacter litoreus]|uniref:OmpH family outer membrane protein n=1 Tax=Celeribacter litoreus TaxID=2876714 RepID=UPI001CCD6372|nr:OmpH family outer membrane protein [Celeribacter litoreus]MCA0043844.1 OmpH family outer membrane protein [Celeribacter litoreus]